MVNRDILGVGYLVTAYYLFQSLARVEHRTRLGLEIAGLQAQDKICGGADLTDLVPHRHLAGDIFHRGMRDIFARSRTDIHRWMRSMMRCHAC